MPSNKVELIKVGALLTGNEHFYVPSYQRGFRWRRKQAEDLMGDLYSFLESQRSRGEFYCLQPLIVRPISDMDIRRKVLGELADDDRQRLWELVDGQQRLTSLSILFKVLSWKSNSADILAEYDRKPFTMYFESRPSFRDFLSSLGTEEAAAHKCDNIDNIHAYSVFHVLLKWFDNRGRQLSQIYKGGNGDPAKKMAMKLFDLLSCDNASDKSVKFIWYQLDASADVNPVREFVNINNGKIPLLDSELVKAIFLQRSEEHKSADNDLATERALVWEMMENRLQGSDFWRFIDPEGKRDEDRMGLLLEMLYSAKIPQTKVEDGDIFRYFYEAFEKADAMDIEMALKAKWEEVIDAFHALEEWFESPIRYNYIGYLTGAGVGMAEIYKAYNDAMAQNDAQSFDGWLTETVKKTLRDVRVEIVDNKPRIKNEYKERELMRRIFKLLNIHLLTSQFEAFVNEHPNAGINDAGSFRFPFGLYKEQDWDIEHIDSKTANPLNMLKDKAVWICGSLLDMVASLPQEAQESIKNNEKAIIEGNAPDWSAIEKHISDALYQALCAGNWDNAIELIQAWAQIDHENIDFIGNLTLLDSATNRGYGNALFCSKRRCVLRAMSSGRYVLPSTQCVFTKFFDEDTLSASSRIYWSGPDKEKHHDFIYFQLKDFLPNGQ